MQPDLARARRFVESHAPPGEVVLVGITGSHQYGFSSADSDVDCKGIHIAGTRELLGLGAPAEAHDALLDFEGVEHDLTTTELGKAVSLLLQGNGNMLERLASPFQVYEETPVAAELRRHAEALRSRRSARHYGGYFLGMQREYGLRRTAKTMLYTYRVALTGMHFLRTGQVEASLPVLAARYDLDLDPLVEVKAKGKEQEPLPESMDLQYRSGWEALGRRLEEAERHSALPAEPTRQAIDAVGEWLIETRLSQLSPS